MFKEELEYFKSHQEDLVAQYRGKVLVLRGKKVLGAYNDAMEAFDEASKKFSPGSFMIQRCEPGPGAYTVTISTSELIAR